VTFRVEHHENIRKVTTYGDDCVWKGIKFETSEGRNLTFGSLEDTDQTMIYEAATCDHIIGFLFPENRNCKPDAIITGPKCMIDQEKTKHEECPEDSVMFGCDSQLCAPEIKECNIIDDPFFMPAFTNEEITEDPSRFGVQTLMRSNDQTFEVQGYMCPYNGGLGAAKRVGRDGSLTSAGIGSILGGIAIKTQGHIITIAGASSTTSARMTIDGQVVGQQLAELADGSFLNSLLPWQECLNSPSGLSIKRVWSDPMRWNYRITVDAGRLDGAYGLCNSMYDWDMWMTTFADSAVVNGSLFDQDTLSWLEEDCRVDQSMLEEVQAGTIAEPRTSEKACEDSGISLGQAKEHCKDLTSAASRAICEVQYCSDQGNKNTVTTMGNAYADAICDTTSMAYQVCTPYYDYKLYGCSSCKFGDVTTQHSWPECMSQCVLTTGCKQVVWHQHEKTCELYTCASFDDEDGTPGANMNYISAVCYMTNEQKLLDDAAVEANKLENRLQPPAPIE